MLQSHYNTSSGPLVDKDPWALVCPSGANSLREKEIGAGPLSILTLEAKAAQSPYRLMSASKKITIIIPAYNEGIQLQDTVREVSAHIPAAYDYRLLFIDDGSSDGSWPILEELAASDPHIQALRFSRNFGKEPALVAGLLEAEGDAVIVMDADLQFPPAYIPTMLEAWEEGYDLVEGKKTVRQNESKLARWAARRFYKLFQMMTDLDLANACDFKLLDRKVIEVWRDMPERANFFRAQAAWVGFRRKEFSFEVADRASGQSKWSPLKLTRLAINAFTSFSAKPLYLIGLIGAVLMVLFIILGITALVQWAKGTAASGFTTVILLQLLIGGSILLSLSLIGLYIERIFVESKGRPRYIISQRVGRGFEDKA